MSAIKGTLYKNLNEMLPGNQEIDEESKEVIDMFENAKDGHEAATIIREHPCVGKIIVEALDNCKNCCCRHCGCKEKFIFVHSMIKPYANELTNHLKSKLAKISV